MDKSIEEEIRESVTILVGQSEYLQGKQPRVEVYSRLPLGIFVPSLGVCPYSVSANHSHGGYSFILPLHGESELLVEGTPVEPPTDMKHPLCCFSPRVKHQEILLGGVNHYIAIFIEAAYYEEQRSLYTTDKSIYKGDYHGASVNLLPLCRKFIHEYPQAEPWREGLLNAVSLQICHEIIRSIHQRELTSISQEQEMMERLIQELQSDLARKWTLEDMALGVNLSQSQFSRRFKEKTEMTPMSYLMELRLIRVRQLIRQGRENLTEIAHSCGFAGSSHLSQAFKNRFGISPSEYAKGFHR